MQQTSTAYGIKSGAYYLLIMNILIQFYTLAYKSKKRKPKILFLIYFNETKVNSITKRNGTILVDNKHPFWWQTFDLTITEPQIKKELLILFPNLDAQNLSDISVAFNNFKADSKSFTN